MVWVPTPQAWSNKMLDMAKVTPPDYLMDLGSGDGRTVITAAKRGRKAMGIEYNPDMVALSKRNAAAAGVSDKATFVKADIFETRFFEGDGHHAVPAAVDLNLRLRPKLLDMAPGTRVVSNSSRWKPGSRTRPRRLRGLHQLVHGAFWIVPAKVDGHLAPAQGDLTLSQQFQMITGTLGSKPISNGRLRGSEITFTVGNAQYTGQVNGTRCRARSRAGSRPRTWNAKR